MYEDTLWLIMLDTIDPDSTPVDHVYDAGILPEPMLTSFQFYLRNKLI